MKIITFKNGDKTDVTQDQFEMIVKFIGEGKKWYLFAEDGAPEILIQISEIQLAE